MLDWILEVHRLGDGVKKILSGMAGREVKQQQAEWRNAANGSNAYIIINNIIILDGITVLYDAKRTTMINIQSEIQTIKSSARHNQIQNIAKK